jgi:hypothetical protein
MAGEPPLSERVRDTITMSRMLREQTAELRAAAALLIEQRARMKPLPYASDERLEPPSDEAGPPR